MTIQLVSPRLLRGDAACGSATGASPTALDGPGGPGVVVVNEALVRGGVRRRVRRWSGAGRHDARGGTRRGRSSASSANVVRGARAFGESEPEAYLSVQQLDRVPIPAVQHAVRQRAGRRAIRSRSFPFSARWCRTPTRGRRSRDVMALEAPPVGAHRSAALLRRPSSVGSRGLRCCWLRSASTAS